MSYDEVVISTITLARDQNESWLIRRGLSILSTKPVSTIVVVDGGSGDRFLEDVGRIPKVLLAQSRVPGLLAQVRTSLHRAQETGARYIFYTEPNKEHFFAESLDEFLTRAMAHADGDHDFGMVLPARSEASFATFPSFQQYTESVANELLRIALDGTDGRDYTYGPRMMASSLVQYLDQSIPDIGWGWMSYLLAIAHRLGKGIYAETMDLPCPVAERSDTQQERMLRIKQLGNHVDALYEALRRHL